MNNQVEITVSVEQEQMLRELLKNDDECDVIYPIKNQSLCIVETNGMEYTKVFFKPKEIRVDFLYIPNENSEMVLYPFDENDQLLPLVEYSSVREVSEGFTTVRLYLPMSSLDKKYRKVTKKCFNKLKRIILENTGDGTMHSK